MAKTTFVDKTTVIEAEWLNEVNDAVFDAIGDGTSAPTTGAEVRTNIGAGTGDGDIIGPASSTDSGFAKFDGLTGKLLKDSAATIAVVDGGTGGTTAAAARTNLSAASSGANSDITSLSGLTTPLSVVQGGTGANKIIAFSAYLGADQSVISGTQTVVGLDTEEFDTDNCFDTTTFRFTPTVAGYYQINGIVRGTGTNVTNVSALLWKNGAVYAAGGNLNSAAITAGQSQVVCAVVQMNGTTDFLELAGTVSATNPVFDFVNSAITCRMSGYLIRAS